MRVKLTLLITLVVCTSLAIPHGDANGQVPNMMNYQGKLTSASGGCLNDTVQMTFAIYSDSLDMMEDWSETHSEVVVREGVFNVLLGSVLSIPATVFDGSVKYLGVQVESDPEMSPRRAIVSTAYAYDSDKLDGMHAGNNAGDVPINNGVLNTNLNADLLDGLSSEVLIPLYPVNKVVRGLLYIPVSPPNSQFIDTFSPEIDPAKSVVVLNDANHLFVVKSLTSSDITFRCWNTTAGPGPIYLEYQIIEYK